MKNKLDFIINEKNLKSLKACKTGIIFAKKYFNEMNFKDLEVEGDFKNYFSWLKNQLENYERIYDEKGNLKSEKNSDGFEVFYSYDKKGNLKNRKDSFGFEVNYFYDKKGNLISKKNSYGSEEFYSYDEKGNLKSWKNSNGFEINYFYDKKGNLKSKKYSYGFEEFFSYDEKRNLKSYKDSNGYEFFYNYKFDKKNRLIEIFVNEESVCKIKYKD